MSHRPCQDCASALAACLSLSLGLYGCADDFAPVATDTETETGSSTSGTSETTTDPDPGSTVTGGSSGADTSGGLACEPPVWTCSAPTYPIGGVGGRPFDVFDADTSIGAPGIQPINTTISGTTTCCDGAVGAALSNSQIEALIWRPILPSPEPLPTIVFSRATGGDSQHSETLFEDLAANGYMVVALQHDDGDTKDLALTCGVRWAQTDEETEDYASCDVVLMGHSSGGYGAWEAGRRREELGEYWSDADLSAVVLIAAGRGASMQRYPADLEVPLLVMSGSTDEQIGGRALGWYSLMFGEPSTPSDPGKALVWAYNFPHFLWGGEMGLGGTPLPAAAEPIGASYTNAFLDREVAGLGESEDWSLLSGESFDEASLSIAAGGVVWDDVPGFTAYSDGVDCTAVVGGESVCTATAGCFWSTDATACANRPMIFTAYTPSTGGRPIGDGRAVLQDFEGAATVTPQSGILASQIEIDTMLELVDDPYTVPTAAPTDINYHETQAMRVLFDDDLATGSVRVEFPNGPVSVDGYTHLSYRAGNFLWMDETTPEDCSAFSDQPVNLQVELVPADGSASVVLDMPPLVQQDYRRATGQVDICAHQVMLHTIRHPLTSFCGPGFGGEIEAIVFHFPEQDPLVSFEVGALIDSIEFTTTAEDVAEVGVCFAARADWDCETTTSLLATETSCTTEPTSAAACTTTQSSVPLPEVDEIATSGTYDGWVVHTPAGWVEDPLNPTTAELDAITNRCVAACEQQWSDNPNVSANCSTTGGFATPTLREDPGVGTVRPIPFAQRRGGGIFAGEELDCDITSDCASVFDESLGMTPAQRPTPAAYPLHVGEEYVFELDTSSSEFTVSANGTDDSVPLYGDVGFSLCPGGNATDPCPFYLGSLSAQSFGTLSVPYGCGTNTYNAILYAIDIQLGQPAFGISQEGTDMVGFPKGSIVFDATYKRNGGATKHVRGTNEVDVVFEASASGIEAAEIPLFAQIQPCASGEPFTVIATIDLVTKSTGPKESPPAVSIDVPSSVTCSVPTTLASTSSDPDGDVDDVRWYVDDELVHAGTTALTWTTSHELKAVVRDDRGAATTATKTVSCTP